MVDSLEKANLRENMANRVRMFCEGQETLACISAHYSKEPSQCDLCGDRHAEEVLVVQNTSSKRTLRADLKCLKEMIRFQVVDVSDLTTWLKKLKELKVDYSKREESRTAEREAERERLGRKVIVRKKPKFS